MSDPIETVREALTLALSLADFESMTAAEYRQLKPASAALATLEAELARKDEALAEIGARNHQDTCEGNYGGGIDECVCHVNIARAALAEPKDALDDARTQEWRDAYEHTQTQEPTE